LRKKAYLGQQYQPRAQSYTATLAAESSEHQGTGERSSGPDACLHNMHQAGKSGKSRLSDPRICFTKPDHARARLGFFVSTVIL